MGIEADGVKRFATRLNANLPKDIVASSISERSRINDRFRHGLNRELTIAITHGVGITICGHDTDTEPTRISLGELGDIRGNLPVVETLIFVMEYR